MRDLKNLKHVSPERTTIWDIMIDPLHMRIRLVINLLVQYINAVKLFGRKDLTDRMWSLLNEIGVTNKKHATKQVYIKMSGDPANATLSAFCDRTDLLDILIDPSLTCTTDFQVGKSGDVEAAYRESLRRKHCLFSGLWLDLRTMLAFIQDSGVQRDLTEEEIDGFQQVAKHWGLQWHKVAPASMPTYVHVLVCHVHQYLRRHCQLGLFSQQPAENKHKELKDHYFGLTNRGVDWVAHLCQREWVNQPSFFFTLFFFTVALFQARDNLLFSENPLLTKDPQQPKFGRRPRHQSYFHENKVKQHTVHLITDDMRYIARKLHVTLSRRQQKKEDIWTVLGDRCELKDVQPLIVEAREEPRRKHRKKVSITTL